ncbi:MAG: flagellar basal body L-ring protein [Kordiimonas sp.]|nr:flagellar basal body L-ring protein [Kordiimonas sp.]
MSAKKSSLIQPRFLMTGLITGVFGLLLSGCGAGERIANIGKPPALSPIEAAQVYPQASPSQLALLNPEPGTQHVTVQRNTPHQQSSLWQTGSKHFFKDQRAGKVGDIVTVQISIDDKAAIDNSTTRTRSNSDTASMPNFLGLETQLDKVLPNAVTPDSLVDMGSTTSNVGTGKVDRSESITLTIAAVVTQVLPNGNLVIQGKQEVRVNFEVRELTIAGVARPEDISSSNTIEHSQIAEARISYGGRGQLTDVQQARYGQQLYDILFPF